MLAVSQRLRVDHKHMAFKMVTDNLSCFDDLFCSKESFWKDASRVVRPEVFNCWHVGTLNVSVCNSKTSWRVKTDC